MIQISEFVKHFTNPLYDWFSKYGLLIILSIVILIEVRVCRKIVQTTKAKKWGKFEYGNTNEWFSIEDPNDKTKKNKEKC